jgi:hypothetical protein
VLGIGRDAVAEQLGIHVRLALPRVLELLEDQDRARLAHHEHNDAVVLGELLRRRAS